jgi:acylphosphatase
VRVIRVELDGLVQGVGFRWFAREAARRRDLSGWVKNRPDGCVEVAASGSDDQVQSFLDELRRGPTGARVMAVRELPTDGLPELPRPFAIVR